jgi:hypothetical protein
MDDLKSDNAALRAALDQDLRSAVQAVSSNTPTAAVAYHRQKEAKFATLNDTDDPNLTNVQAEYRTIQDRIVAEQKAAAQESAKRTIQQKQADEMRAASECNKYFHFAMTNERSRTQPEIRHPL